MAFDGCTLSPDGWWKHCCDEHDLMYFIGGSWWKKIKADWHLARCMAKAGKTRAKRAAGVVVGGVFFLAVSTIGLIPPFWDYTERVIPTKAALQALDELSDEALDRLDSLRLFGRSPLVAPASVRRRVRNGG